MRHLEDKQCCPDCGRVLHRRPYVMSRQASENVLSWGAVAWIVVFVTVLVVTVNLPVFS